MAILIKATADKKITISGTGIELPEVYGRIRFLEDFNGTTIQGEVQSLDTAHKYAKLAYEQMGYEVIIDLTL